MTLVTVRGKVFKHVGFKADGSSGTQQGLCFLLVNNYLFSPKVIPNRKGKTPDFPKAAVFRPGVFSQGLSGLLSLLGEHQVQFLTGLRCPGL